MTLLDSVDEVQPAVTAEQSTGPRNAAQWIVRGVVIVLGLSCLFVAILYSRGWRPSADDATLPPRPASGTSTMPTSAAIESTYGLRFTGVDVTAGGGMIQIRFQVLDSDKTEAVHGTDLTPYIVDGDGHKFADPGMAGHSHVGKRQAAGTTDYILLANASGRVKAGSVVTIKVGDLQLGNVPVG